MHQATQSDLPQTHLGWQPSRFLVDRAEADRACLQLDDQLRFSRSGHGAGGVTVMVTLAVWALPARSVAVARIV